jgi:hypothetical protein
MKSGFKDPTAIKKQHPKDNPKDHQKESKTPWDFTCPQYDQRSSCFVNAGTHYGVGHKQPVGHQGNPKSEVDVLPKSRRNVNTMEVDEAG